MQKAVKRGGVGRGCGESKAGSMATVIEDRAGGTQTRLRCAGNRHSGEVRIERGDGHMRSEEAEPVIRGGQVFTIGCSKA